MKSILINGHVPLHGTVRLQGSKNASLPLLAAAVLVRGVTVFENCPRIADVFHMIRILEAIGCLVTFTDNCLSVDATRINRTKLPDEYVRAMRCSVFLMGAMLGRVGEVLLDMPGGCVIGARPIDIHLEALRRMGVVVIHEKEIHARVRRLRGTVITLPFASVGATENVLLCAARTVGITVIHNAAMEPEIVTLCAFLSSAGVRILGAGTSVISVRGVRELRQVTFRIPSDRIVAGTYLLGTMATGGCITLLNAPVAEMERVFSLLRDMGGELLTQDSSVSLKVTKPPAAVAFTRTEVYPGFPTDLQALLMVALSLAKGKSAIEETIFESRFQVAGELCKMGARIKIQGNHALLEGVGNLRGASVRATELRGGAALVMAGLAATKRTVITDTHFIERGYEDIVRDLRLLGARISWR